MAADDDGENNNGKGFFLQGQWCDGWQHLEAVAVNRMRHWQLGIVGGFKGGTWVSFQHLPLLS
jgi:hypothetical protein